MTRPKRIATAIPAIAPVERLVDSDDWLAAAAEAVAAAEEEGVEDVARLDVTVKTDGRVDVELVVLEVLDVVGRTD